MKIKSITPKFPELVSKDFKTKVEAQYKRLTEAEEDLYNQRDLVRELEVSLQKEKDSWEQLQSMFIIEFEKEEEDDSPKGDVDFTLGIINHSDYRNKNV